MTTFLFPLYLGSAVAQDTANMSSEIQLPAIPSSGPTATPDYLIDGLFGAWGENEVTLVLAFTVSLLVWVLRSSPLLSSSLAQLPKHLLPWITIGLAVLGGIADALISGASVPQAIIRGIVVGLCGAGSWSAGGRHLVAAFNRPARPERQTPTPGE